MGLFLPCGRTSVSSLITKMHQVLHKSLSVSLGRLSGRGLMAGMFVFVGYLLAAQLGRVLGVHLEEAPIFLWPPAGFAIAALYLAGLRSAPYVLAASAVNVFLFIGLPLESGIGIVLGSTAQAALGAWILRRFGLDPKFGALKDFVLLAFVALLITALHPSFIVGMEEVHSGERSFLLTRWVNLWLGNIISVLVFTPLVLVWGTFSTARVSRHIQDTAHVIEAFLVYSLLFWSSYLFFQDPSQTLLGLPYIFPQLAALLWISLRYGVRDTITALFGVSLVALAAVGSLDSGGVVVSDAFLREDLVNIEQYLIILCIGFYIVAAVAGERQRSASALRGKVDELEQALATIKRSERAKTEFIAILAHELRNPLTPIVNYVELIKRATEDSKVAAWIGGIEMNMRSVVTLLNDILDVTRVTERKFSLHRHPFILQDAIHNALIMAEPVRVERQTRLSIAMPREPIYFDGDRVRIEQVFTNLLTNAMKYSPPRSLVRLDVRSRGPELLVEIADEGVGVSQAERQRIFEPFVQISEKDTIAGGLGIGLFLSKSFVELHGGEIAIKSEGRNRGSTFSVSLPMSTVVASPASVVSPMSHEFFDHSQPMAEIAQRRVLVVDDRLDAAVSLARLIESSGYLADVANDGDAALRAVRSFHPDTIFLDIRMPGMDGYEVAKKLRDGGVEAKIVALTGFGQQEDKDKAARSGFDEHLTKPVDILRVIEIINAPRPRSFGI